MQLRSLFVLLALLLCASTLSAANVVDEGANITQAQRLFISAAKVYYIHLDNCMGCCPCKVKVLFFNSDAYFHIKRRLEQVELILELAVKRRPNWKLVREIVEQMGDFESEAGRHFKECYENFLGNSELTETANRPAENELTIVEWDGPNKFAEDGQRCVVCLTNKRTVLALPCHHLAMCENCTGDVMCKSANASCPICRSESSYLNLENFLSDNCQTCSTPIPNMMASCGHVALCKTCYKKTEATKKIDETEEYFCIVCGEKSKRFTEVFRSN